MTAAARSGAAALPVRPGERRWTEPELAKVHDALAAEAAELRADIERAESGIADRLGDAVGDAGDDQADVGAKTYERQHELALAPTTPGSCSCRLTGRLPGSRRVHTGHANRAASRSAKRGSRHSRARPCAWNASSARNVADRGGRD